MKVSVYLVDDGTMSVLVEASPGKARAPVLLVGVAPANVSSKVLPLVVAMRRPRGAPISSPG